MKHVILAFGVLLIFSTLSLGQDFQIYDEGIAKFKEKDYPGVIDLFTKLLTNPDHNKRLNEDLYFYRGQSYFHTGQYDASLADLEESLKLNHFNKPVIVWYKARCADKLNRASEAETLYAEAISLAEKNKKVTAQILADRAQFFARTGKNAEAQHDIAKARELDPSNKELAGTDVKAVQPKQSQSKPEEKSTKVIVKSNPPKETPKQSPPQETKKVTPIPASENNSTALVSALAEAYKDEKRYALVIGNSDYNKEIGTLKNPVNDATDIATELRKSDFDVHLLTNATYIQIREAMRRFQEKLSSGPRDQTVGLFYYAGHGVQYQDENYLVPVDANVKFEDDIVRMCFPVQRMVLANMENTNSRMNIIILDACRNNPFPATTRSVSQGLAEMKRARGSFIAYATAPGSVASDGSGRNGLYTQELLKSLRKSGLTIEQVFKEVRMNVLRLSGERQFTWDSSNIIGEFYFKF